MVKDLNAMSKVIISPPRATHPPASPGVWTLKEKRSKAPEPPQAKPLPIAQATPKFLQLHESQLIDLSMMLVFFGARSGIRLLTVRFMVMVVRDHLLSVQHKTA
jgi:hypothetical protein